MLKRSIEVMISSPICSLQDRLTQSSPAEDNVETDILVEFEQNDVQSAPSDFSTLEIQVSDVEFNSILLHLSFWPGYCNPGQRISTTFIYWIDLQTWHLYWEKKLEFTWKVEIIITFVQYFNGTWGCYSSDFVSVEVFWRKRPLSTFRTYACSSALKKTNRYLAW